MQTVFILLYLNNWVNSDVFSQNQSYVPSRRTEITEYEGKILVFNQNEIIVSLTSFVSLPS